MAYAFGRVAAAQRGGGQDKADIFGQEAGQQQPQAVVSGQQAGGGKRAFEAPGAVRSSTEGSLEGGGTGGETTTVARQDQTPQQSGAKAARAAKSEAYPGIFGSIQGQIQQADTALQDEANKYATQARSETAAPQLSEDKIRGAVKGDEAAKGQLQTLLGGAPQREYNPTIKTNTTIGDVGLLESDAGLRQLLSRGQGPGYTQGMANLDVAGLKRDPNYQEMMRQTKGAQQALYQRQQDIQKNLPGQLKGETEEAWKGAKEKAVAILSGMGEQIKAQNDKEAAAINHHIQNLQKDPVALQKAVAKQMNAAYAKWKKDTLTAMPEKAPWISNLGMRPVSEFVTFNQATPEQMWSADEAGQYNSIMGLLGAGGVAPTPSQPPGSPYSFDANAYQQALSAALEGNIAAHPEYAQVTEGPTTYKHTGGTETMSEGPHFDPAPTTTAYDVDNGSYTVPTQELNANKNLLPAPIQQVFDYVGKKGQGMAKTYAGRKT